MRFINWDELIETKNNDIKNNQTKKITQTNEKNRSKRIIREASKSQFEEQNQKGIKLWLSKILKQ